MGTGFAHPNKNELLSMSKSVGIRMVPMGSICVRGLMLTRPKKYAVLSPSLSAAHACAAS